MGIFETNIGKLGFGMMRLPKQDNIIDLDTAKRMVDEFIYHGFNYFDTAFVYDGSEEAVKKILVDRYPREKYILATKLAPWAGCPTKEDAISQFTKSLERTGAGYFDFYLIHNLGGNRTDIAEQYGIWEFVAEKKKEGLIKHIGFSFHSTADELDVLLAKHPETEFVQLQINYADWENDSVQSRKCYEIARKYGKSIIVMEPVKGGRLAKPLPAITELFKSAEPEMSPASWAIRFAANLEGVITVLSGMSTYDQMLDNVFCMKNFKGLTSTENEILNEAQEILKNAPLIPCTSCDYCAKVCPMNIAISSTFSAANDIALYGDKEGALGGIKWHVEHENLQYPQECISCGACSNVCPQHIDIPQKLAEFAENIK